ncbi:MAG: hypothetical protein HXY28_07010 [Hydrogenophilaceae bacterium]|jgi:hypothetical protein|nr:hypothetical protein [Hydrogenophilaceae bacterium]
MQFILLWVPSLLCGLHAIRTGREQTWLWILVIGGPLGAAIYVLGVIVPELLGGRTARRVGQAARQALDPERELRDARRALEDTPAIGNRMRVAKAAAALGRWDEAEEHWRACAQGQFADDPTVLLGHATALIELGRFADALKPLEALQGLGREGQTPYAALAFARAYEGLGRFDEADAPYRFAADRVPGLEAGARYVAFMAKAGRREDAQIGLKELDRRLGKIAAPLRGEARRWRDLAARALDAG